MVLGGGKTAAEKAAWRETLQIAGAAAGIIGSLFIYGLLQVCLGVCSLFNSVGGAAHKGSDDAPPPPHQPTAGARHVAALRR